MGAWCFYRVYANLPTEGTGLHLHILKRLDGDGIEKYFSIGFGGEMLITDEKHYAAMVTLGIHPWRALVLSVAPGFEWENMKVLHGKESTLLILKQYTTLVFQKRII